MKKYTFSILILSIMFFGFLGFNVNSASAFVSGCTSASQGYSTTTGQPCGTNTSVVTCPAGDVYSSDSGKLCTAWQNDSGDVANFNSLFKSSFVIGSRGADVKALQQFLASAGYFSGKVDGRYGRITARAIRDFQDDHDISTPVPNPIPVPQPNNTPVISGIVGPQTLNIGQQGTWNLEATAGIYGNSYKVIWGDEGDKTYLPGSMDGGMYTQSAIFTHIYQKSGIYTPTFTVTNREGISATTSLSVKVGSPTPSPLPGIYPVTVLSPNGGEVWTKGTTQTIKWQDNAPTLMIGCAYGSNCTLPVPTYNINLIQKSSCNDCGGVSFEIAKGVSGYSYNWTVGNNLNTADSMNGNKIFDGSYYLQVCRVGTNVCDSSDSYFKIASDSTTTPTLNISYPQKNSSFSVGPTTVKWSVSAPVSSTATFLVSLIATNVGGYSGPLLSTTLTRTQAGCLASDECSYQGFSGLLSGIYSVTVKNLENNAYDASPFTIAAPSLQVSLYRPGCSSYVGYSSIDGASCDGSDVLNPVVNLSANPSSVSSGNSSTLTWSSLGNNLSCTFSGGSVSSNGSQIVYPTATTNYSVTCTNPAGKVGSGFAKVNVVNPNYRPGCSSTSGYSSADGASCALPTGCTSYSGYSSTSGGSCSAN